MIKAGDRVIAKINVNGVMEAKIRTVKEVIETPEGKFYHIENDFNNLIHETEVLEILPEKKEGLYITINCDAKLEEKMESIIEKAMKRHIEVVEGTCCELQEYATNEHSYYTSGGKEMLSTWKQKGDHVYDVHVFEKVSPSNWKQLS